MSFQSDWDNQGPQRQDLSRLDQLAPQRHQFARQAELSTLLTPLAAQIQLHIQQQADLHTRQEQPEMTDQTKIDHKYSIGLTYLTLLLFVIYLSNVLINTGRLRHTRGYPMTHPPLLKRLAALDTNTVSDALDFLGLAGATVGLRPLWNCPKIVGRASTVLLAPKLDAEPSVHLITPVVEQIDSDDRVLVIAGGLEGISCWGDILANAAVRKQVRGTVIDGLSRDINGSAAIGYPVYGRGVTMIIARNRVMQNIAAAFFNVHTTLAT